MLLNILCILVGLVLGWFITMQALWHALAEASVEDVMIAREDARKHLLETVEEK